MASSASSELAALEVALKTALMRAAPLPAAARQRFIGQCLLAAHTGEEMPTTSSEAGRAESLAALKGDVPALESVPEHEWLCPTCEVSGQSHFVEQILSHSGDGAKRRYRVRSRLVCARLLV